MIRHRHDGGHIVRRTVDHEYVHHHTGAEPGLLVVRGVPADVCRSCDDYWFDESTGFALSDLLADHTPAPGEVLTLAWIEANAA